VTKAAPSKSHRIRSLSIIGGFRDLSAVSAQAGGEKFDLADLPSGRPAGDRQVGARGTGKTTVLEFVRYAMPNDRTPTTAPHAIHAPPQPRLR